VHTTLLKPGRVDRIDRAEGVEGACHLGKRRALRGIWVPAGNHQGIHGHRAGGLWWQAEPLVDEADDFAVAVAGIWMAAVGEDLVQQYGKCPSVTGRGKLAVKQRLKRRPADGDLIDPRRETGRGADE